MAATRAAGGSFRPAGPAFAARGTRSDIAQDRLADRVGVGAEPDLARRRVEDHVPHRAAATRDRRDAEELLRRRIEADELVRPDAGLDEPRAALVVDRHRVRTRFLRRRRAPLVELARGGIVAAEIAFGVVDVPDLVVRRDPDPPAPGPRPRELDLPQLHRRRVDRPDLVRAEEVEPRTPLRVDHDP